MAGVVLQNGNLVWQKVKNYLSAINTTAVAGVPGNRGANPGIVAGFAGLKAWLAQQKRNPDLQFIPFSAANARTAGGYLPLAAGACTLYGVYAKARRTSATTAEWLQVGDGTDNTGGDTQTIVAMRINLAGDEYCYLNGNGTIVAAELYISATTTLSGQTETTTDALAMDGFVIVGA
jgi:hypothetical protein